MKICYERWQYIEMRHSITAEELCIKFGFPQRTCATWLSNQVRKGYLKFVPDHVYNYHGGRPSGRYVLGDKWWGENLGEYHAH